MLTAPISTIKTTGIPELFYREVTNLSGTNLNVGVYDNGLKGVGQEARSNYDRCHERAKLCVPLHRPSRIIRCECQTLSVRLPLCNTFLSCLCGSEPEADMLASANVGGINLEELTGSGHVLNFSSDLTEHDDVFFDGSRKNTADRTADMFTNEATGEIYVDLDVKRKEAADQIPIDFGDGNQGE